jgi:hypothetical protein
VASNDNRATRQKSESRLPSRPQVPWEKLKAFGKVEKRELFHFAKFMGILDQNFTSSSTTLAKCVASPGYGIILYMIPACG